MKDLKHYLDIVQPYGYEDVLVYSVDEAVDEHGYSHTIGDAIAKIEGKIVRLLFNAGSTETLLIEGEDIIRFSKNHNRIYKCSYKDGFSSKVTTQFTNSESIFEAEGILSPTEEELFQDSVSDNHYPVLLRIQKEVIELRNKL